MNGASDPQPQEGRVEIVDFALAGMTYFNEDGAGQGVALNLVVVSDEGIRAEGKFALSMEAAIAMFTMFGLAIVDMGHKLPDLTANNVRSARLQDSEPEAQS